MRGRRRSRRTTVNRYAGRCCECGGQVAAKAGVVVPRGGAWRISHLACHKEGSGSVMTVRIGGNEYIRNTNGRCIDAPCCGCCTI